MADEGKSLDELIEEAEALLEQPRKKRRGESDFQFHRDSLTGHRTTKLKYRPRCKRPTSSQSTAACTSSSFEGSSSDVSLLQDGAVLCKEQICGSGSNEQSLEEVLEKCQSFLHTLNSSSENVKWERRMEALNENWGASRPEIFKALLLSQSPGGKSQQCDVCRDARWVVRCDECSGRRMCYKCDVTIHDELLFHDREAWADGCFQHIPPTFVFSESGRMEQARKHLFYSHFSCPQCQGECSLAPCFLPGSIIVVNQKGRFDFNNYAALCQSCGHKVNPFSLEYIIAAGYWPGSPRDLTYLFDQNLFRQWDFVQKRLPGTSETSFLKALGDFSQCKGRASTITATTFSRAFKEWKFCMYELQNAQGISYMDCPACSLSQHSCHVDGNMKLYRFKSSGMQKRPCYYGAAFISSKHEVDSHIKHVYSKAPRSKNAMDNMCGESHWKAADNTARRRAKLDETGLEIAGCRHGLAQWAVNMYQGEIYGYAHFVQSQKMFPAGVKFFWQDIVCKYWKWARKVGGPEMSMKPALSVMHAKAHKWSCQVLWGGRWQEGTACTTGEEVEQINAHMSRCGNTSKYMLPEGRDELLTEHALSWNRRKIFAMIPNLVKRFTRATAMFASSKEDCAVILQQYNLQLKDIDVHLWKQEIIQHAKDEEIMSSSRVSPCNSEKEKIKQQMEMLSFSIARTTQVINKQTDTSKQRTRLRKKITSERSQLKKLMDQFNALVESNGGVPLTIDNVLAVEPSLGGNDQCACNELPIRVKSKIVDAFQIHDRWTEEIALLKLEMSNLLCFYTEKRIPALKKDILELEDEIKSWVDCEQRTSEITENNEQGGKDEQTVVKYSCLDSRPELLQGKIALLKKGLAFCSEQVRTATGCFQKIIDGDAAITNDTLCNDCDEQTDHSDNDDTDSDDSDDDGETRDPSFSVSSSEEKAPMRAFSNCNTTCIWEFPYHISQSTYNGRNGSNACSLISLLIAQGIHQVNCDLLPSPMLPSLWVTLVCGCIKVGNDLYDRSRGSLPQRYLSAAEAAMVAGDKLEVSIRQPFPVRICDSHQPSTMRYQLLDLCNDQHTSFAVLTVDEKTVLFAGIRKEKLVLVDTHLHGQQGAIIILGKPCNVDNFVCAVQQCLGFHNDTFGNLVHIQF